MKKIYEPYLDKNVAGSKILKSLGSDKKYNKKGVDSKTNGEEIKQDSISVNDAKVRLHRMNKLPKNSIQYQLNGGELAANIYRDGIQRSRGNKEVEAVKPPKPTSNASLKPLKSQSEEIKVPNGKITYSVTAENRIIKEGVEDSIFYEYMSEYDVTYVFNSFLENPRGKQNWGTLINPSMYQKALSEFTKYGKLVNFPKRYVYQWMGIIMKNTAILRANTDIAGHSQYFPYDEFEDFINSYFGNNREIEVDYNDNIKIEVSFEEAMNMCMGDNPLINENAVDKYGQTYLPWITQSDANRLSMQDDTRRMEEKYGSIIGLMEEYNENHRHDKLIFDNKNAKVYWSLDVFTFLDEIGIYDWMEMPDGSDAFSDYGLEPLYKILQEYNEDLEAEKVLVLVNKALDVYHQRGDMSSIFIVGGRSSLNRIAEEKKRNTRKIYINENQILKLKNGKR